MRHPAGIQIFAKGDPGNSMMAVLKGRVMISAPSPDGRQVVLTVMREGDVFGEIALLDVLTLRPCSPRRNWSI